MADTRIEYRGLYFLEDPQNPGQPATTLRGAGADMIQDNFKILADSLSLSTSASPTGTAAANTLAIQTALDTMGSASGGIVNITVPGTYLLATAGLNPYASQRAYCIDIKYDNTYLNIGPGVVLKLGDDQQTVYTIDGTGPVDIIVGKDRRNIKIAGGGRITGNTAGQSTWIPNINSTAENSNYSQVGHGSIIHIFGTNSWGSGNQNVFIEDLQLDDHFSNPVNVDSSTNVRLKNLVASDCGEGLQVSQCMGVTIENVSYKDTRGTTVGDGIETSVCSDVYINNCYVEGIGRVDYDFFGTNLVIDATNNKKVTSASHTFDDYDLNRTVRITAGTGWTTGYYSIKSTTGGAAILSSSPSSAGNANQGTWVKTAQGGTAVDLYRSHNVDVSNSKFYKCYFGGIDSASNPTGWTDLTIDGSNNKLVSSPVYTFVAGDIRKFIKIFEGTNWTKGYYRIVDVSAGKAILDASPSAVGNANLAKWFINQVDRLTVNNCHVFKGSGNALAGCLGDAEWSNCEVSENASYPFYIDIPSSGINQLIGGVGKNSLSNCYFYKNALPLSIYGGPKVNLSNVTVANSAGAGMHVGYTGYSTPVINYIGGSLRDNTTYGLVYDGQGTSFKPSGLFLGVDFTGNGTNQLSIGNSATCDQTQFKSCMPNVGTSLSAADVPMRDTIRLSSSANVSSITAGSVGQVLTMYINNGNNFLTSGNLRTKGNVTRRGDIGDIFVWYFNVIDGNWYEVVSTRQVAKLKYKTGADSVILEDDESVWKCNGSFTVTLGTGSQVNGFKVGVKNMGGGTVTIGRNGKTIDSVAADTTIASGVAKTYVYDSTNNDWISF